MLMRKIRERIACAVGATPTISYFFYFFFLCLHMFCRDINENVVINIPVLAMCICFGGTLMKKYSLTSLTLCVYMFWRDINVINVAAITSCICFVRTLNTPSSLQSQSRVAILNISAKQITHVCISGGLFMP